MDVNSILEADRQLLAFFNGSSSLFVDSLALTLTSGFTWIPLYIVLIYIIIKNNKTMPQIALAIGCAVMCVLVASVTTELIVKPLVARWRPSNDPYLKYTVDIVGRLRSSNYGFFSAHAANTFSLALFVTLLVRSKMLAVALVAWSAVNCWTRLYLGLHYPLDILCGLAWGTLIAIGVYRLYTIAARRIDMPRNIVSTRCTATGYAIADMHLAITILALLVCYAAICATINA